MERGLDGVLVSAARVLQAVQAQGLSSEHSAGRIEAQWDFAIDLIDALTNRVKRASDEDCADRARQRLHNRLDQWGKRRKHLEDLRKSLVYERVTDDIKENLVYIAPPGAPKWKLPEDPS